MAQDYSPRSHQGPMGAWLKAMPKKALHAGCGTGKTVVVATHVLESIYETFDTTRWLIVGPKLVAEDTWAREFAKWNHLKHISPRLITADDMGFKRAVVEDRQAGLDFVKRFDTKRFIRGLKEKVHVTSFATFPWIVRCTGVNFPYDGIVLDESALVKDSDSQRWKAANHAINKLPMVREVIELSGVPIPKGYADLRAQFILLDKGERLGHTKTEFRHRWQEPDPDKTGRDGRVYDWRMRAGMVEPIQQKIAELAVSAEYDTGVELIESEVFVQLSGEARRIYNEMEKDLLATVDDVDIMAASGGVKVSKLLQICNGGIYDNEKVSRRVHEAKVDAVVQELEAATSPILLAYPFKPDAEMMAKRLGKKFVKANQPGALDAFRRGDLPLLAFHPASMSHGVDGLQEVCDTVLWFGATHNWDWYHQVYMRVLRSGQKKRAVFVRRIIADNTIELGILREVLAPRGKQNDGLLKAIRWK